MEFKRKSYVNCIESQRCDVNETISCRSTKVIRITRISEAKEDNKYSRNDARDACTPEYELDD